jgi:hypothetical protein
MQEKGRVLYDPSRCPATISANARMKVGWSFGAGQRLIPIIPDSRANGTNSRSISYKVSRCSLVNAIGTKSASVCPVSPRFFRTSCVAGCSQVLRPTLDYQQIRKGFGKCFMISWTVFDTSNRYWSPSQITFAGTLCAVNTTGISVFPPRASVISSTQAWMKRGWSPQRQITSPSKPYVINSRTLLPVDAQQY